MKGWPSTHSLQVSVFSCQSWCMPLERVILESVWCVWPWQGSLIGGAGVLHSSQVRGQLDRSPSLSLTIPKDCFSSHLLDLKRRARMCVFFYFMILSYGLFWWQGTTEHWSVACVVSTTSQAWTKTRGPLACRGRSLPARVNTHGLRNRPATPQGRDAMMSASRPILWCVTFTVSLPSSPCRQVCICFGQKVLECVQALLIFRLYFTQYIPVLELLLPRFMFSVHLLKWKRAEGLRESPSKGIFYYYFVFFPVELTYNVMLVSGVQCSDSTLPCNT